MNVQKQLKKSGDLIRLGQLDNGIQILESTLKKFPKQFIEVDYEKLVTETETTLSLLFQKLEMNWDQQFLNYHKMNTKAVRTASSNQVRNGIYRGSSRDWEKFGEFLEPLKSELTKYKLA